MKTHLAKLKHILPTFLAISFGTVVALGLIRWLFSVQFSIIDLKEEIWEFWLPITLPWIPVSLWLRQRLRVLVFKADQYNGSLAFQFIAWLVMTAMLISSQEYLVTATGKLQQISAVEEIEQVANSRYYRLQHFSVMPSRLSDYTDFRPSGKRNQRLNFDVYMVLPIVSDTAASITGTPKYWYGVKYNEQISNRLGGIEKEKEYQAFYMYCRREIEKYNFQDLDHFERVAPSDDRDNYLKAIGPSADENADEIVVLKPVREVYEHRTEGKLSNVLWAFGLGTAFFTLLLFGPGYSEKERKRFLSGKKPKKDDLDETLQYFIPKGDHFATSVLADLNILVFLVMIFSGVHVFSPNGAELLDWGANRRLETTNGEIWRLFTSMFVHGGVLHLFLNLYGLLLAAIYLEPLIGRKKYFMIYILSGLGGSIASIAYYPNTISVGASGAIFGLFGALFGLFLNDDFSEKDNKGMLWLPGTYVGISLLLGFAGGVDNAAHIGGFLCGAVMGMTIRLKVDD